MADASQARSTSPRRKVFGIGYPRTGTTSLVSALNLVGIKTVHNPAWLQTDFDDPRVLEFDGFADSPVPLIYPELDRRFPGSLFILTDRDVDEWLQSVEWMITVGRKHGNWDANSRTVSAHTALYGSIDFRPEVFRERFLAHRERALAYFAGRSNDLLVVDLSRGGGWRELCPFLGVPMPHEPFPHLNRRDALYIRARLERRLRGLLNRLRDATRKSVE